MKLIVSSGELQKALQTVSGVIASSQSRPILENYLFELSENQLNITASDGETTLITSLEVMSEDKGKLAVPA
ncbi:MAG: DNA polymerase III subunit beta, partial [Bergeyella zoohelcum]|nr:DNA polymerase III subunit beta [Bergeyella zoohelcum]